MKQLNFKAFTICDGVAKRRQNTVDVSEVFADIIYQRVPGIRAHELAMRIYKEGEISVTPEEERLLIDVVEKFCTPAFIDGIMEQLNNQEV